MGICCLTQGAQTCALRQPGWWDGVGGGRQVQEWYYSYLAESGIGDSFVEGKRDLVQGRTDVEVLMSNLPMCSLGLLINFIESMFLRNKNNSASAGLRTSQGVPARMLCKLEGPPRCEGPGSGSTLALSQQTLRILLLFPVRDSLACFHLLAGVKNAAMNMCVQMSVCAPAFSPLALCSTVELLILW